MLKPTKNIIKSIRKHIGIHHVSLGNLICNMMFCAHGPQILFRDPRAEAEGNTDIETPLLAEIQHF